MRALLPKIVLLGLLTPMGLTWDAVPVINGRLEAKKGLELLVAHSEGCSIENSDGNRRIQIPGKGSVTWKVTLTAELEAEGVDDKRWFGRVTCDVWAESAARVNMRVSDPDKDTDLVKGMGIWKVEPGAASMYRPSLLLEAKVLNTHAEKTLHIHIENQGSAQIFVDEVSLERFHPAPTRKLLGKPNGKLGPDLLASGALGFWGLTEHNSSGFSILEVREKGPAQRAGLQVGDVVLEVQGVPLTPCNLRPGWDWFESSHEARLGRALQAAIDAEEKHIELTVYRDWFTEQIKIEHAHAGAEPDLLARGPLSPELQVDVLDWILKNQKKNGSWPGTDAVNPYLGGLALLATRDPKHREAIERCKDFVLKKNPKASEIGGFSYWAIAFQGMFLAEYHLATGDEEALAWVREAVLWLPSTTHETKWGTQAFGHSPKGLPYGGKSLAAPTTHLLIVDALARRCGIESEIWKHVRPYMRHAWSNPGRWGPRGHGLQRFAPGQERVLEPQRFDCPGECTTRRRSVHAWALDRIHGGAPSVDAEQPRLWGTRCGLGPLGHGGGRSRGP